MTKCLRVQDANYCINILNMIPLYDRPIRVNKASQDKNKAEVTQLAPPTARPPAASCATCAVATGRTIASSMTNVTGGCQPLHRQPRPRCRREAAVRHV